MQVRKNPCRFLPCRFESAVTSEPSVRRWRGLRPLDDRLEIAFSSALFHLREPRLARVWKLDPAPAHRLLSSATQMLYERRERRDAASRR